MKDYSTAKAEVRAYAAWLVYARVLLLVLFTIPVGVLIYSIATQNPGAGTASIIIGISFGLFYRRAGRLVLRDLRRRRDRAWARVVS